MNATKTKVIIYNLEGEDIYIKNQGKIKVFQDFQYLDSGINDSQKDIKTRKAQPWSACKKLYKI